jgi:GTPase SAR1 family protein
MHKAPMGNNSFSLEKEMFMARLDSFIALLCEARDKAVSPELAESFGKTIEKAKGIRDDLKEGKLKIALVGAFSDGKTSTIAGFVGHSDPSMKIATEESSYEIVPYTPKNIDADVPPCEFVDTPGLFGQKFSHVTEDYISQAHVILYIVNATNPLKESHKDTVAWLMNTMQKFDKTIFVINLMDDVCDYTDNEDFDEKKETKSSYLRANVARYCDIAPDDERIKSLNVVCISSDPGQKGLTDDDQGHHNYWLTVEHREKYELYSRMPNLRGMVSDVVRKTLPQELMHDVALVAVNEEVRVNCEKLQDEAKRLEEAVIPEIENMVKALDSDVKTAKDDLRREIRPCRRELESLEKSVCGKIRDATFESFNAVIEDEIGAGEDIGYKIQGDIQDILTDHFGRVITQTCEKMSSDIELGEANVATAMDSIKTGAKTIGTLAKGVDKAMIFAGRELLGKIGIVIKFKPWEAAKWANFASKTLPAVGAAVSLVADIGKMVAQKIQEQKLAKAKSDMIGALQGLFKDIYICFNNEAEFYKKLTPQILDMEGQVVAARHQLEGKRNSLSECSDMRRRLSSFWSSDSGVVSKADSATTRKSFFSFFKRK